MPICSRSISSYPIRTNSVSNYPDVFSPLLPITMFAEESEKKAAKSSPTNSAGLLTDDGVHGVEEGKGRRRRPYSNVIHETP